MLLEGKKITDKSSVVKIIKTFFSQLNLKNVVRKTKFLVKIFCIENIFRTHFYALACFLLKKGAVCFKKNDLNIVFVVFSFPQNVRQKRLKILIMI